MLPSQFHQGFNQILNRMIIFARPFLIVGVAFISYGLARWYIVPEIGSRQGAYFQQFITTHAAELSQPTNSAIAHDFLRLRMQVMMSGGSYPGWPQAVIPCALGLMFLGTSYYFSRKSKVATSEPSG